MPLDVPKTDAAGVTTATGSIGEIAETTLPLKAHIKVSIHEPGGRTTDKTADVRLATRDVMIGIRPEFDGGSVADNAPGGLRGHRRRPERQAHRAHRPRPIAGCARSRPISGIRTTDNGSTSAFRRATA